MLFDGIVGDHYNCKCPHCGQNNSYVTRGIKVRIQDIKSFSAPCFHCKKVVFYHAQYVIKVTAYPQDPIEILRKPTEETSETEG